MPDVVYLAGEIPTAAPSVLTDLAALGWTVHLVAAHDEAEDTEVDGLPVTVVERVTSLNLGRLQQRTPRWTDLRVYRHRLRGPALAARLDAKADRWSFLIRSRSGSPLALWWRLRLWLNRRRRPVVSKRHEATILAQRRRNTRNRRVDRLTQRLWVRLAGDRAWQRLDPGLWEPQLTFGPTVDELRPDVVLADDPATAAVGARASIAAVWDSTAGIPPTGARRVRARDLLLTELGERVGVVDGFTADGVEDLYRRGHG